MDTSKPPVAASSPVGAVASSETQRRHCPSPPRRLPLAKPAPECPMTSLFQILLLILDIAQFIIIAHIIMSWLINFQVLNLRQPLVASIWDGLNRLLEPVYARVRQFMPNLGGLDLAPLVVLIAVYALRIILINNVYAFA
jgi:YggT family protein